MKVLLTEPLIDSAMEYLGSRVDLTVGSRGEYDNEESLIRALPDYDGVITMLSNPVTARVLEASGRLKVVANYAVGYNNIDVKAARERGIVVTNTPDVLSEATADIALALLLGVGRRIGEAEVGLRGGEFDGWHPMGYIGVEMFGKTAGMVGMGRIGKAIVRRLAGFGIHTKYHNRNRVDPTTEKKLNASYAESLDEMLLSCDFLFLSCPLTPETHHIIDKRRMAMLPDHCILINTGRGPLVDEEALAEALIDGKLGGAGLDVFELEPLVHPKLLKAPNTLLLPHIGSATRETRHKMGLLVADSVIRVLQGDKDLPNIV